MYVSPRFVIGCFLTYFILSILLWTLGTFGENDLAFKTYFVLNFPSSIATSFLSYLFVGLGILLLGEQNELATTAISTVSLLLMVAVQSCIFAAVFGFFVAFIKKRNASV